MTWRAGLLAALLCCCSTAQLATPDGQLFCRLDAGPVGSITVGIMEAAEGLAPGVAGLLVLATNAAKSVVDGNCAAAAAKLSAVVPFVGTAVPPPAIPVGNVAITPVPGTPVAVLPSKIGQ